MITKSTTAFYEDVVRVPLVVRWPGRVRPGVSLAAANLVDLMPTLMDLTGLGVPPGLHGHSLGPLLLGAGDRLVPNYAFCERLPSTGRLRLGVPDGGDFMVRGQDWKCVRYRDGKALPYERTEDPGETRNRDEDLGAAASPSARHPASEKLWPWTIRTQVPAASRRR